MRVVALPLVAAAGLLLAGCTGGTTRVLVLGPDTYRASSETIWLPEAEEAIFRTASTHCAGMGREIQVIGVQSRPSSSTTYASATVNFRCLPSGDPELVRPTLTAMTDVVLVDSRRVR